MKKTKTEKISDLVFDLLFSVHNFVRIARFFCQKNIFNQHSHLKENVTLKGINQGEVCFVLGNGPSLKSQDLAALKDQCVFMVNRSFWDKRYLEVMPKYHVIVDAKLANGQWPITYLDDIAAINPGVTFVLNSKWFYLDLFKIYKSKYKIIWIDLSLELTRFNCTSSINLTSIGLGKNVVENGIITAMYLGFTTIYISGVDGDGFANLLLGTDSHSYGVNKDDVERFQSWVGVREALSSVCRWMLSWYYLDRYAKHNGVRLINLSGRGIITMLEMDDFSRVVGGASDQSIG